MGESGKSAGFMVNESSWRQCIQLRNFIISECEEAKEDLGIKMSMCCFKAPPKLANWECQVVKPLLIRFLPMEPVMNSVVSMG